MFEVVQTSPPYESVGFRRSYREAVELALDAESGERYGVWQVADDAQNTRVCLWAELVAQSDPSVESVH